MRLIQTLASRVFLTLMSWHLHLSTHEAVRELERLANQHEPYYIYMLMINDTGYEIRQRTSDRRTLHDRREEMRVAAER